ncbi:hypothetical protein [Acinetobacter stercoris]|uniref:Tail fiber assembly protein n=1 Tax=Acinetobacter stercoris TaxID=2126983 RepID=A0A2U3N1H3_9GAMM|nr:hypothetical protein [Acinetobacter stercoris]SPL71512.1 hypothetical protein KPC_2690 [Acinetobacter stercoris]
MTLISEKDQIIMAYSYDADDQRLVGSFEYLRATGTGLPAQSTNIQPPTAEQGFIPVFDVENQQWGLVEDHRRKTVYSTDTGLSSTVDYVGAIKDGFTFNAPQSVYEQWEDDHWIDPRSDAEKEADRLKAFAPLTRRQFKLTLLEHDLLDQIEQAIDSIQDATQKKKVQIEYAESEKFERSNESVRYMLGILKLSDEQVDEMWRYAMSL